MIIRRETSADFPAIYSLVEAAFKTARHAEGDEQDFVERQRHPNSYIPDLALVLEDQSELIAYIMLTRTFISTQTGRHPVLLLAAVSVVFERRNQGIGSRLIEAAFQRARAQGHKAVILVGDPAYYSRFGFKPSIVFGITNTNQIEDEYVQAYELVPGALRDIAGTISLPA